MLYPLWCVRQCFSQVNQPMITVCKRLQGLGNLALRKMHQASAPDTTRATTRDELRAAISVVALPDPEASTSVSVVAVTLDNEPPIQDDISFGTDGNGGKRIGSARGTSRTGVAPAWTPAACFGESIRCQTSKHSTKIVMPVPKSSSHTIYRADEELRSPLVSGR